MCGFDSNVFPSFVAPSKEWLSSVAFAYFLPLFVVACKAVLGDAASTGNVF